MKSSNMPEAPCDNKHVKKYRSLKTLNPRKTSNSSGIQQSDQTASKDSPKSSGMQQSDETALKDSPKSCRDGHVIYYLDSCSETELKELKDKFVSDLERIRSFVKRIEARELELVEAEQAEYRKTGNCGDKSSNVIGQKRTMPVTPDTVTKRKRLVKTVDLNSSSKTRKVEADMMRKCGVILEKLMKHKHGWLFNEPVDIVTLRLDDYHQVVKRPMDLGTVKAKLGKRVYSNPIDFAKDVRLTFDNALLYNRKGEDAHIMATVLLDMFDKLFDPAYEKFEVECKRVIVEQQKLSKPLSEFMQSQIVVSSQQDTEKPLKMHPQAALSKIFNKEAAAAQKSVSQQKRTVPKAKENPRRRRDLSQMERDQLGMALQDFAGEYLDEILQILAKRNSKMAAPDGDGEIELDVQALDSETMWDLNRFVKLKNLKAQQSNEVT
ncbi:transcription factor GTE7-like [Apium graveolens]|uniref:transcription factor GTE7-like n=1 Tax=Apium graveolens TaxID=4045 RepID=UPI003D7B2EE8